MTTVYFFAQEISIILKEKTKNKQTSKKQWGFPGGSDGKESACNAGELGSIHRSGRSPGEGNGNSRQYSSLENPMDRESGGL